MEAFDLYSPAIDANPFPYYEALRERHPCYWSESGKLWVLSHYDDIVPVFRLFGNADFRSSKRW